MKKRPLIQMKDGSVLRPPRYTWFARYLLEIPCAIEFIARTNEIKEKTVLENLYLLRDSYNLTLNLSGPSSNRLVWTDQRSIDRIKILFPYLDERNVYREIK